MGISPNSLSRKLNGKRQFTLGEVEAISRVLELQNPAAVFFDRKSQIRNEREA